MRAEEKQQAENGREAAKLYARWEHLDGEERERLLEYAEEGKNSPAFAEQLMTHLSYRGRDQQEAVLLLAGSLESGGRDGQLSSTDARLYRALSGSLAAATGPDSPIDSPGGVDLGVDQQAHHHGPRRQRPPRASPRLHRRRLRHAEGPHGPDGRGRRREHPVRPEQGPQGEVVPLEEGRGRPGLQRGVPDRGRRHHP
ncbi:hypothetical protein [Streptomyces californicus]|uniref:hypothetical protein n=1 Tax=Streptomyces californicus TaxID=67351 RepID=UPI00370141DC